MNKFPKPRPYADPEAAARKLMEIAAGIEPIQDGRLFIEKLNAAMLYEHKATPAEYKAGLDLAVTRGWLQIHESGTFVRMLLAGSDLFGIKSEKPAGVHVVESCAPGASHPGARSGRPGTA